MQFAEAIRESADRNDDFRHVRGEATRGQISDLADDLNLTPGNIDEAKLASLFGGVDNLAPKILAIRRALAQSAREVAEKGDLFAENPAPENAIAYANAVTRHDMIQGTVSKVTAEWGRAGHAFRSLMEGWDQAQDINALLKANTGRTLFQLQMMAKLGKSLDTPGKVAKYLRDARKRSFGGMALEYWINGLISGPATHTTYMVGNAILAAEKAGPETAAAAGIGALRRAMGRHGETVRLGEVGAQFRAAGRGLAVGVEAALEGFRTGMTTLLPGETARPLIPFVGATGLVTARNTTNAQVRWADVGGQLFGMVRSGRDALQAGAALVAAGGHPGAPAVVFAYSPLGQIPDMAIRGVLVVPVGSAIRLPGRFIAGIHSFFRAMNYSMEKSAIAYRTASEEGHTGTAFDARVGDIWQNPSEEIMQRARHEATQLTLMGEGSAWVRKLAELVNTPVVGSLPLLKFVSPFVHIAANVIDQSLIKRTPLGAILSAELRADLAGRNGTVAADTAAARMLVGTALSTLCGGLAAQGYLTGSGPSDPNEARVWRLVYQPHSVRVGDMWYQVNRLGPLGMLSGIAADMYDVAHTAAEGDMLAAAAHLQHAFTQNVLDESFMRGPAELLRAIEDPGRYGEAYLKNFVASFVPFSVGMAQIARAADPHARQARTVMDAIVQKVPGMSQSLMPRRDVFGEELPSPDALGLPGLSAIWEKKVTTDPVNLALAALGIGITMPERKIRNVDLTDAQYDDYARVAGRLLKMNLDKVVNSGMWERLGNAQKHDVIKHTLEQTREAARAMTMMKFPQIPYDSAMAKRKAAGE